MSKPGMNEIGTTGLKEFMGYVEEAFHQDLKWPGVQPLYSRLRRSDPEISMVRHIFSSLARSVDLQWQLPDDPNDAEKAAGEFGDQVLDDMEGGSDRFLETLVSQVPFMGWGWWEAVPAVRSPSWTPPDPDDDWRSQYTDGRIGLRRLAWRDSSSFARWDMTERGRLRGMVQQSAFPAKEVTIPLANSLHLTFGDANNPEGLAGLEPVWRLERIKYGLEVIQGIGFEHSAGYLSVSTDNTLSDLDKVEVAKCARAVLTAQEGNYAVWPKGATGEVKDINFQAGAAILEAIKYFGVLKLSVFMMQWVALSATTGAGSYAAMDDSSSMFIVFFNAMMEGFARQMDAQIGRRLFEWNRFPGMRTRPKLTVTPIEKKVSLADLAQILGPLSSVMPLGDDDLIAIRRKTNFLPETLPEVEEEPEPELEPKEDDPEDGDPGEEDEEGVSETARQMAERTHYWAGYLLQHPEAAHE